MSTGNIAVGAPQESAPLMPRSKKALVASRVLDGLFPMTPSDIGLVGKPKESLLPPLSPEARSVSKGESANEFSLKKSEPSQPSSPRLADMRLLNGSVPVDKFVGDVMIGGGIGNESESLFFSAMAAAAAAVVRAAAAAVVGAVPPPSNRLVSPTRDVPLLDDLDFLDCARIEQ